MTIPTFLRNLLPQFPSRRTSQIEKKYTDKGRKDRDLGYE
jgi:hypothetical protein